MHYQVDFGGWFDLNLIEFAFVAFVSIVVRHKELVTPDHLRELEMSKKQNIVLL